MATPVPHTARLTRALATWRQWPAELSAEPVAVRLLEGASNTSVLLDAGDEQFVIRLDHDSRHLGVDRDIERMILTDIRECSFAPPVVFMGDDFLVMRHLDREPGELSPEEMAALIREIHGTPTRVDAVLNPADHARHYLAQLDELAPALTALAEHALAAPAPTAMACLSHIDLIPGNIIFTGESIVVLDWEYARLAHPAWDAAVVIEAHGLNESAAAILNANAGVDSRDVRRLQQLYRLIEALWWTLADHPGASAASTRAWQRLEALLD